MKNRNLRHPKYEINRHFLCPSYLRNSMKKIYHLSSCNTCQKILKELSPGTGAILQDIKTDRLTAAQIDEMAKLAGGFEPLFSRKAIKYRTMGLGGKSLTEKDYRQLILDEYTFLKRPVILAGQQIFIGNAASTIALAKAAMQA